MNKKYIEFRYKLFKLVNSSMVFMSISLLMSPEFAFLPGWILFFNRSIAWWWLIFRFDAMIEMIVVHVTVIIVVMLPNIVGTTLDDNGWSRVLILTRHKIRWISMIGRCWNGRYVQIRESCFVHWIRWLENITSYFEIEVKTKRQKKNTIEIKSNET